jgi:hypothetical protein
MLWTLFGVVGLELIVISPKGIVELEVGSMIVFVIQAFSYIRVLVKSTKNLNILLIFTVFIVFVDFLKVSLTKLFNVCPTVVSQPHM